MTARPILTLLLIVVASSSGGVDSRGKPQPAAVSVGGPFVGGPALRTRIAAAPPTRSGTWAYAKASYGPDYLAIPEGPGWHVTVCGPKGCVDRVSTDAGPELWLQRAGRIGDLAAVMFEEVCGPLSAGLCDGSYTITGRADQHGEDPPEHPDDERMRLEDRPLPATDTGAGPAMTSDTQPPSKGA